MNQFRANQIINQNMRSIQYTLSDKICRDFPLFLERWKMSRLLKIEEKYETFKK